MNDKRTLSGINNAVNNRIPFRPEDSDVWYTVEECLVRKGGDCDDIQLGKYQLCLALGYPEKSMYMVAGTLKIGSLRGATHMILVVGKWVLCNIYGVVSEDRYLKKFMDKMYGRVYWELRQYNPKWIRYQRVHSLEKWSHS
ncbi:MAG: transglutaminase-like cysteine peptidase [Bacteroidia bacterium]|nr:transglutaminase-like cysteine peptidase [Bacteroidia bacterium]